MRIVAQKTIRSFAVRHPTALPSLNRWIDVVKRARWTSPDDARAAFPTAKVIDGERIRFEVAGGAFRLIAAFDFRHQIVYIKFLGTQAEYDGIDARTVSRH